LANGEETEEEVAVGMIQEMDTKFRLMLMEWQDGLKLYEQLP